MAETVVRDFLTTVIMDDRVRPYFHIEDQPGRMPVKIYNNTSTTIDEIELFGAPAVVRGIASDAIPATAEDENIIIIDLLEVSAEAASLRFRHPVEGVVVEADYSRQDNGSWSLTSLDAYER
ncbi:MAG: hypothetical protein GVY13_15170 [Alphaproteobacteria bacterium]|nr:hypothetical protein [Alphaproteobacteria bacterium]